MSKTETGAQLLARLGTRPSIADVEPELFVTGPEGKEIYEIVGSEGTGKSELLLHIVSSIILPKSWKNLQLNGSDARVIFIDTDFKFSILRLAVLMEKKITERLEISCKNSNIKETPTAEDIEAFITNCLKKLYVVRCSSSSQLLITLHSLETQVSNDPDIAVVMIDSISAFYWLDKSTGGESTSMQELRLRQITDMLSKLVNDYNLMLFATRAILFQRRGKDNDLMGDNSSDMEYLCKAWQKCIDFKLYLTKSDSSSFHVTCDTLNISRSFVIGESGIKFITHSSKSLKRKR